MGNWEPEGWTIERTDVLMSPPPPHTQDIRNDGATLSCTRCTSTCLPSVSWPTECVSCVTLSLVALSHVWISGRWRTTFQSAMVWSGGGFLDLRHNSLSLLPHPTSTFPCTSAAVTSCRPLLPAEAPPPQTSEQVRNLRLGLDAAGPG